MKRSEPSLTWLSSVQTCEAHVRQWIPDHKRQRPLNTGWQVLPFDQSLDLSFLQDILQQAHTNVEAAESKEETAGKNDAGMEILDAGLPKTMQMENTKLSRKADIVSLPYYEQDPLYLLKPSFQEGWFEQEKELPYAWDGLENLNAGQIPKEAGGFWLVQSVEFDDGLWELGIDGLIGSIYVFCNGEFAGMSKNRTGVIGFDLEGLTHPGFNTLALLVVPYSSASWLEYGLQDGWFGLASVCIQPVHPDGRMEKLLVWQQVRPNLEEGRIWIERAEEENSLIHVWLQDPTGDVVLDFESHGTLLALDLVDLQLWSMENPQLYTLSIEFCSKQDQPVRWYTKKIGFRLLQEYQGIWKMNGKKLLFKGLKLASDFFETNLDWKESFRLFKKEQVNALYIKRTPCFAVMELAEQYGIGIVCDMDLHTGAFPGTRQGFVRLWKPLIYWKLQQQMDLARSCCSLIALRSHQTIFPEDDQKACLRLWKEHNQLIIEPMQAGAWCRFTTQKKAMLQLHQYWEKMVFFEGVPRLEEWEELQRQINFGGLFLHHQQGSWKRPEWSWMVQDYYTPWRLGFDKRGIRMTNQNQFMSADNCQLSWIVWKNPHEPIRHTRSLYLPPQTSKRIFLGEEWNLNKRLMASVDQITAANYAHSGFSMASKEADRWHPKQYDEEGDLDVVFGQELTSITGRNFTIRFDPYGPVSLICNQQEMLAGRPEMVFSYPDHKEPGDRIWKDLWKLIDPPKIERDYQEGSGVLLKYDYTIPTLPASRIQISYSISWQGLFGVDIAFKGSSSLMDVPYLSWSLPLLDPLYLAVHNNLHLLRLSRKRPENVLNVEYAQAYWENCRMTLSKVNAPLQIWILPASFSAMRSRLAYESKNVWLSAGPDPVEYEKSDIENDAYKRIEYSFILELQDLPYPEKQKEGLQDLPNLKQQGREPQDLPNPKKQDQELQDQDQQDQQN